MIESISKEVVWSDGIISLANSVAAYVGLMTIPDFDSDLVLCLQPFGVESSSNFETTTPLVSSFSVFWSVSQSQQAKNISFGEFPTTD